MVCIYPGVFSGSDDECSGRNFHPKIHKERSAMNGVTMSYITNFVVSVLRDGREVKAEFSDIRLCLVSKKQFGQDRIFGSRQLALRKKPHHLM